MERSVPSAALPPVSIFQRTITRISTISLAGLPWLVTIVTVRVRWFTVYWLPWGVGGELPWLPCSGYSERLLYYCSYGGCICGLSWQAWWVCAMCWIVVNVHCAVVHRARGAGIIHTIPFTSTLFAGCDAVETQIPDQHGSVPRSDPLPSHVYNIS